MKHKIWGLSAFFICCWLIIVARHHPPSRRKIKQIWHGRVFWEKESNTSMLRSSVRVNNTTVDTTTDTVDITADTVDITADISTKREIQVMVSVLSRRSAFETRQVIRETWASGHNNVFFVVGTCCPIPPKHRKKFTCTRTTPSSITEQSHWDKSCANEDLKIADEEEKYKDMIRVSDYDVYYNLPKKVMSMYEWTIQHTEAKWIAKTDDDCYVRIGETKRWLNTLTPTMTRIGISAIPRYLKVFRSGQYAENKYPKDTYPPFLLGGSGYIISSDIAKIFVDNQQNLEFYMGEDTSQAIWIETLKLNTKLLHDPLRFTPHAEYGKCDHPTRLFSGHTITPKQIKTCYESDRRRYDIQTKKDVTVAGMVTIKGREKNVVRVIDSLKNHVEHLFILCATGCEEITKLPVLKESWISVLLEDDPHHDCEKFLAIERYNFTGYFFTVDDDIIYPEDYVNTMKKAIDGYCHKAVVSVHGGKLPSKVTNFAGQRNGYHFNGAVRQDSYVNIVGTGVTAFHTSTVPMLTECMPRHSDLAFAKYCQKNKVPMIVLKQKGGRFDSLPNPFTLWGSYSNSERLKTTAYASDITWKIHKLEGQETPTINAPCNVKHIESTTKKRSNPKIPMSKMPDKDEIRNSLKSTEKIQIKNISPFSLDLDKRFDIIVKSVYAAEWLEKGTVSVFTTNMYNKHLKVWNNFQEPCKFRGQKDWFDASKPCVKKASAQDFTTSFQKTIQSLKETGFDNSKSIVPVTNSLFPLNGAHRIAAALALGMNTMPVQITSSKHAFHWNANFFIKKGFDTKYADFAMLQFLIHSPRVATIIFWPEAVSHKKIVSAQKMVRDKLPVLYSKQILVNKNGVASLTEHAYGQQNWLSAKIKMLQTTFNDEVTKKPVIVMFAITKQKSEMDAFKLQLRKHFNLNELKSSVHISDFHAEANIIGEMVLNDNSVMFMNRHKGQNCKEVSHEIAVRKSLKEAVPGVSLHTQDIMVDSGAVMSFFGLRKRTDIDILFQNDIDTGLLGWQRDILIEAHAFKKNRLNEKRAWGQEHIGPERSIDDLFTDPDNFGYCHGIKYVSLDQLIRYKSRRGEKNKDEIDVEKIRSFLKNDFKQISTEQVQVLSGDIPSIIIPEGIKKIKVGNGNTEKGCHSDKIGMKAIHGKNIYKDFKNGPNGPAQRFVSTDLVGWGLDTVSLNKILSEASPKFIIEVGSWKGLSAVTMADWMKKTHGSNECLLLISVDTWLGTTKAWTEPGNYGNTLYRNAGYPSVYYQFLENVIQNKVDDIIVPLPLPGNMGATTITKLVGTSNIRADLIFIDGCHDYECVVQDIVSWWPMVKTGGTIFGDDVDREEVKRAVKDVSERIGAKYEIIGRYWRIQKKTQRAISKNLILADLVKLDLQPISSSSKCVREIYGTQAIHGKNIYKDFKNGPNGPAQRFVSTDLVGWGLDTVSLNKILSEASPKFIIEVGSWKGLSAVTMADWMKKTHGSNECLLIICVDTWLGTTKAWTEPGKYGNTLYRNAGYPSVYYQFLENIIQSNADDIIVPLPLPGNMGSHVLQNMASDKQQADLIFIDGCHDYECVEQDIVSWWPMVKTGGTIFGDDVDREEVKRAVKDVSERIGAKYEIIGRYWRIQKKFAISNDGSQSKLSCNKAVCVNGPSSAGLGHRLCNLLQSKMMSLALEIPMATLNLEKRRINGMKYTGLNDLFPLTEHIVDCSPQNAEWNIETLNFAHKTGTEFNLNNENIQQLRQHVKKAPCNTVFSVKEFWPSEYEATFPWLREIFTTGGMQSTTAKNIIKNLAYDKSRFNIAVHFRAKVGAGVPAAFNPTPPAYFQAVIRQLLTDLKPLSNLPIDITIFSENFADLPNKLRKIATESGMDIRVKTNKEFSAVATMVHFGLADIFIASDSSMGWIPTWIAGNTSNPVVIAAPSTRSAQTWTTGTIRSEIKGTYDDREKIISKANSFLKIDSLQSTKKRKSVVGVVFVLSHSSRSKSGVAGLERRNSIRETWKKDVPDNSIFRFVMDKTSSLEILNEAKTYGDILFLETKQKGQAKEFGKKLMEMSKWALQNYDFKYMFRVDDDNFLCIEHIFHDLKSLQYPESIVWGWWLSTPILMNPPLGTFSMDSPKIGNVCSGYSGTINAKNNWRPDEMLIIISANLVEEMFGGTKAPRTWDLMDVTIIQLLKNTKITYMVDNARIQRGMGTYGPNTGPNNIQSYCKTNIAYHKAHPEMIKKLWKSGYEDYNNYNTVKIHKNCIKN